MIAPLWRDKIVTFPGTRVSFRIKVNSAEGPTIYEGKAYARPGEEEVNIRINDICADYIQNVLPTLSSQEFSQTDLPLTFYVQYMVGQIWLTAASVSFINDWSYDPSYNPATMGMAFPINGRMDLRQWLMYTSYDEESVTATVTLQDGTSFEVIIPVAILGDFNRDFNLDFARSVESSGIGTAVFRPSIYGDVKSITIGARTYDVVTDCKEWVLYYVNAYGGWDSLLIEGITSEQDGIERHTSVKAYDNGQTSGRGRENFANEITKKFTMHTGFFSDDEASRMHHLLNATTVYLYNINSDEMLPVVLDNTSTDHKTYKSNGSRLVNYTITATLAQDRTRR